MSDAYREALRSHGLADVQPGYRKLLLSLKSRDPRAYEEAVSRYHADVEAPEVGTDPVAAWVTWGRWLTQKIEPGTLKSIDENGRARDAEGPAPLGEMLIHLPEDARRRGFVVAMPAEPSDAQRETAALLCE